MTEPISEPQDPNKESDLVLQPAQRKSEPVVLHPRTSGPLPKGLTWLGAPLSAGFALAIALRKVLYQIGIKYARRAPLTVISIGNLTVGGTGKTPMTIYLIRKMIETKMAAKPAVLMRGYGAKKKGELNDEAREMKNRLHGIPVLCSPNRYKISEEAFHLGCDVAILDDGFQHWQLFREFNIVLLDSTDPFGQGHLLPWGWLRESPSALKRADAIVLTRCDLADPKIINEEFITRIRSLAPHASICKARHAPLELWPLWNSEDSFLPRTLQGKSIFIACGLGNPTAFCEALQRLGADIKGVRVFKDHHRYSQRDLEEIASEAKDKQAECIVVTEKDAVKLQTLKKPKQEIKILALGIAMRIEEGEQDLWRQITSVLRKATPKVQTRIIKK